MSGNLNKPLDKSNTQQGGFNKPTAAPGAQRPTAAPIDKTKAGGQQVKQDPKKDYGTR